MANRKLDMGLAWTQATGWIGSNRDTIGAIAGLFFFLPSLALALFAPELVSPEPAAPAGADPQVAMQAMMNQITQAYTDNWLIFAVITIVQFVGSLALLALLTDRGRPTVREALMIGLASMLPYLAAQVMSTLGIALVIGIPLGLIAAAGSPIAALLVGFVLVLIGLYIFVKFTLTAPVMAIEGERNPVKALMRSWRLTKGNSFRIALFLLLLFFTIGIIAALVTGILGLALSALGTQIATIGNGVVSAIVNAGLGVLFLLVIGAVHRQLAGQSPEGLAATFE
jgi:membrane-anchored glycerophosphoryl diester phosphodiesterase (GDPDase)